MVRQRLTSVLGSALLSALLAQPALAKPPAHAPAHGYKDDKANAVEPVETTQPAGERTDSSTVAPSRDPKASKGKLTYEDALALAKKRDKELASERYDFEVVISDVSSSLQSELLVKKAKGATFSGYDLAIRGRGPLTPQLSRDGQTIAQTFPAMGIHIRTMDSASRTVRDCRQKAIDAMNSGRTLIIRGWQAPRNQVIIPQVSILQRLHYGMYVMKAQDYGKEKVLKNYRRVIKNIHDLDQLRPYPVLNSDNVRVTCTLK